MEEDNKDNQTIDDLVEHLKPLVEHMKYIHDMAVVAYTPLVDDICSRNATRNEVELMLDWLLMYAGDDRMLQLYYAAYTADCMIGSSTCIGSGSSLGR